MLDSDLALLYNCKNGTKSINQAVNRNRDKFPEDFYFQVTKEECKNWSQFGTGSKHNSILPHVFTEEGVAMLSSVLHTDVANKMSVKIMRAFVTMRKFISTNIIEQKYINNLVLKNDERLSLVENTLDLLTEKEKINTIFFEGEIYDAYELLMEILSKAQEEIIIIDNYAGKELLKILKNINTKIVLVSSNFDEMLIDKYKKQYDNIEFIKNDKFHDRFIILDRSILYNSGASFKDLGSKCFAINKIEDKFYLNKILKIIEK